MNKKSKILFGFGLGGLLLVALAYYGLSPLWRTIILDESAPESAVVVVDAKLIVPTSAHPASGTAQILETENGLLLRYENLQTINGPDLRIYLSTDLKATDYVDLGAIKATEGSVNYNIPAGTDIEKYHYALVWCEQFGVLFNSADLSK